MTSYAIFLIWNTGFSQFLHYYTYLDIDEYILQKRVTSGWIV